MPALRVQIPGGGDETPWLFEGDRQWVKAAYLVFQILLVGEADDSIDFYTSPHFALVFLLAVFSGLGVFAALIGFVNDTVRSTIDGINEGQSKIAESGHTLILGWNESTVRVVCQLAFLHQQLDRLHRRGHQIEVYFPKATS